MRYMRNVMMYFAWTWTKFAASQDFEARKKR